MSDVREMECLAVLQLFMVIRTSRLCQVRRASKPVLFEAKKTVENADGFQLTIYDVWRVSVPSTLFAIIVSSDYSTEKQGVNQKSSMRLTRCCTRYTVNCQMTNDRRKAKPFPFS